VSAGSRDAAGDDDLVGTWLPGLHEDLLNPPRQDRSRRSMAQILAAAETVWTRDGPDGFTMVAVSEESGISIGGLYSRFNGKQGLLLAVEDRLLTRLEHDVAERLQDHGKGLDHTVRELVTCLAGADLRTVNPPLGTGHAHDELDARGSLAWERLFASFRAAALRDVPEIGHDAPELALSMAFHVAISSLATVAGTARRTGLPDSVELIREEIIQLCLGYLHGGAA
jgi:AcrR family transcriptional regulator